MMVQPGMNDLQIQDIFELAQQGHRDQAREALKALLREDPTNADAWLALAKLAESKQDAILCLERVVRLQPDNQRAAHALSRLIDSTPAAPLRREPPRRESNFPMV